MQHKITWHTVPHTCFSSKSVLGSHFLEYRLIHSIILYDSNIRIELQLKRLIGDAFDLRILFDNKIFRSNDFVELRLQAN